MDLYELIKARTVVIDSKPFNVRWYTNKPTTIFLEYEEDGKRKQIVLDLDDKDIKMLNEFISYHHS